MLLLCGCVCVSYRERNIHAFRLRARAILVGAFLVNIGQKMQLIPVNVDVLFV